MSSNPSRYSGVIAAGNITGQVAIANGGTGQSTQAAALTALLGSSTVPIANGGTGQATDPLPPWMASDYGLDAMTFDPAAAGTTILVTAGTVYLQRINIRTAMTVSNVYVTVTTPGNNTPSSAGTFVGLYSSSGTLLSGSADVAASLTTNGTKALALTTPQTLTAGTFVWAGTVFNLGTTQPTLAKSGALAATINLTLAAASLRSCVNGTLQTSLPSPIVPANNVTTGFQALHIAIG